VLKSFVSTEAGTPTTLLLSLETSASGTNLVVARNCIFVFKKKKMKY
jgi:hypothetical protein